MNRIIPIAIAATAIALVLNKKKKNTKSCPTVIDINDDQLTEWASGIGGRFTTVGVKYLAGTKDIFSLTSYVFEPLLDSACLKQSDIYLRNKSGQSRWARALFIEIGLDIADNLHTLGHTSKEELNSMKTEVNSWWSVS